MWRQRAAEGLRLERERREKRKKKEEGMILERKGPGGVRTTGRLQACLQCFSHPGWLAADSWISQTQGSCCRPHKKQLYVLTELVIHK